MAIDRRVTPPVQPPIDNVVSIGAALRQIVLRLIDAEIDPSCKKQRIFIAYQHGHLSAEEAESWIVLAGLEAA